MSNLNTFMDAYKVTLAANIAKNPDDYVCKDADVVAGRMMKSIANDSYAMSPAIQAACRKLGIKTTRKAISEFLAQ